MLAGLVVRAGALDGAVVLRDMQIDGPGTKRSGHLSVRLSQLAGLRPVETVGEQPVLGRVKAHGEEHRVRHVGLETQSLRATDQLQQLYVAPPAMHPAPADLA